MKRIMNLRILLILLSALLWGPLCGANLIENGKSSYRIVLPDDAIPAEITAAAELQNHLKQMSGAELPVIRAAEYDRGPAVAVGFNSKLPQELQAGNYPNPGEEEIIIGSHGDTILLAGGRPRGALYAVYHFLEEQGIRWFTPQETYIPSRPTVSAKVKVFRHTSPFISRTQVPGNGVTAEWCARNRMNSFIVWGNPGEAYGGGIKQGVDMHTFWRFLNPAEFKNHPEWAAEINGKREVEIANHHWGVCLSQQDLRQYLVARTMDYLAKNPAITDVWVGQNDGSPYCQCAECTKFYAAHGDAPSSLMVVLANELAEQVAAKYPEKRVKMLAYHWTRKAPTGLRLHDNVMVMLCATTGYFASLGTPDSEDVLADFRGWKQIGKLFDSYLYSYPTDSSWFPAPCLYTQARNIKYMADFGAKGVHQELFGVGTGDGGELVHLRSWLYIKLLWDPSLDPVELARDFCSRYYGKHGALVFRMIDEMHRKVENGIVPKESDTPGFMAPYYLDTALTPKWNRTLKAAWEKETDPVLKKRLSYVCLPWLWADFWTGIKGLGQYQAAAKSWGIPMSDREQRAEYGKLIKQFMLDNKAGALRLGVGLNPNQLMLDGMTRSYPAVQLKNNRASAVIVPGCFGKPVEYYANGVKSSPFKPGWGMLIFQYPRVAYWQEIIYDNEPQAYGIESQDPSSIALRANHASGNIRKTYKLEGNGALTQETIFKASKAIKGTIRTVPMLNLNEDVFGIYPILKIGRKDGTWSEFEIGKVGTMWYQTGNLDLNESNGKMILTAESGKIALEIEFDPAQVGTASYMYDRYDFNPKGTGRMMDLIFISPETELQSGGEQSLRLSLRMTQVN